MTKTKKNKQKGNNSRGDRRSPLWPPPMVSTIQRRNIARWTFTNSAGTQASLATVTVANLADIYCFATAANVAYRLWNSAIRLRRVSIWGAPSSTGAATTCSVDFLGVSAGSAGTSQRRTDVATGTAQGPVVHARPPKSTQTGMWQASSSTSSLFAFQCTAGSIVEVEFDGTNNEEGQAQQTTTAPAAGSAGQTYMGSLTTGLPAATGQTPVGFQALA